MYIKSHSNSYDSWFGSDIQIDSLSKLNKSNTKVSTDRQDQQQSHNDVEGSKNQEVISTYLL